MRGLRVRRARPRHALRRVPPAHNGTIAGVLPAQEVRVEVDFIPADSPRASRTTQSVCGLSGAANGERVGDDERAEQRGMRRLHNCGRGGSATAPSAPELAACARSIAAHSARRAASAGAVSSAARGGAAAAARGGPRGQRQPPRGAGACARSCVELVVQRAREHTPAKLAANMVTTWSAETARQPAARRPRAARRRRPAPGGAAGAPRPRARARERGSAASVAASVASAKPGTNVFGHELPVARPLVEEDAPESNAPRRCATNRAGGRTSGAAARPADRAERDVRERAARARRLEQQEQQAGRGKQLRHLGADRERVRHAAEPPAPAREQRNGEVPACVRARVNRLRKRLPRILGGFASARRLHTRAARRRRR